ncbi:MAG TPA: hypothetical protein VK203_17975 [Nostocaceae cyanobacterium]|nr:hypothetical protein [Nostocaceae cyanobacterium]
MAKSEKLARQMQQKKLEQQQEEKLMNDVLLLLTNLFEREEVTVKIVLGCLYDVGATNLVNQKLRYGIMNAILKKTAKMSKPVFKMIAWQWFKMNCPQLITDWLRSQVQFAKTEITQAELLLDESPANLKVTPQLPAQQIQDDKIKRLNFQVNVLTGLLFGMLTIGGISFMWLSHSLNEAYSANVQQLQNQLKILEAKGKQ